MVAWTSSSGIPVQAYRTVTVAEALAERRRRWRRQGRSGSGAGRAAVPGAVLRFGSPCDQFVDRVLDIPDLRQRRDPTVQNCADAETHKVPFWGWFLTCPLCTSTSAWPTFL